MSGVYFAGEEKGDPFSSLPSVKVRLKLYCGARQETGGGGNAISARSAPHIADTKRHNHNT